MYNRVSPPTLIALCREVVRETKESALGAAPGADTVPCTSWHRLSCSSRLSCLPTPARCKTLSFLVLFHLFAVFLFLQLLNFSFVPRTCFSGGCFHLYFWSPDFYSLGRCYCVWHVLQNSNQSWNTAVNIKVGINGVVIDLETVYGLLLLVFFFLLKHFMEPSTTFKPNPPLELVFFLRLWFWVLDWQF